MMDMVADGGTHFALADVERLQSMKTGALITAACAAGAIIGRASDAQRAALADYARGVGIAFQIADDLLDTVGDQATVGKDLGRDADARATLAALKIAMAHPELRDVEDNRKHLAEADALLGAEQGNLAAPNP